MKFEFAFFAGRDILVRVLPSSSLALPVNELCLLFLPNTCTRFPYEISCFFSLKFSYEIS
jgi:hypothetical protein